jgi:hypothetical protein
MRDGELGFTLVAMPHSQISLKALLSVWRNFNKLIVAIDHEVAGREMDWKVQEIMTDQIDDAQRITIKIKAQYFAGAQAEQLFIDLVALLKERQSNERA